MRTFDVAIAGNGILALTTALRLIETDPTLRIAIAGPSDREGGASQAAGAMLSCFGEITGRTFKSAMSRQKFAMGKDALRAWPGFLAALNADLPRESALQPVIASYVILNSRSGAIESDSFTTMLHALLEHEQRFEEVDPSRIPGLRPTQNERPLRAIYLPDEGALDSRRVLGALHSILSRKGVTFIEHRVAAFDGEGSGFRLRLHDGEYLGAARCLLAAGVFTQELLDAHPELTRRIPRLFPGVGVSINLTQDAAAPLTSVVRTCNRAGACGLHALPLSDGSLYVGASNDVFIDPQLRPMAGIVHFLLDCAMEQINPRLYRSNPVWTRVGNRPVTADGFPLIGATSWPGLYILTGTYRDGFHQSPVLSRLMADTILGRPAAHPFQPERPLHQTMTKKESIELHLDHLVAAYYEHDFAIPKIADESSFRALARGSIETTYRNLAIDFGMAPEMTLMHELSSDPARAHAALLRAYGRT